MRESGGYRAGDLPWQRETLVNRIQGLLGSLVLAASPAWEASRLTLVWCGMVWGYVGGREL